jgi:hypothetical protein
VTSVPRFRSELAWGGAAFDRNTEGQFYARGAETIEGTEAEEG